LEYHARLPPTNALIVGAFKACVKGDRSPQARHGDPRPAERA